MAGGEIGAWLDELASAAPTPGGGAAAALQAGIAAALLEMTANLTLGKQAFRAHEEVLGAARAEAQELRALALELAIEDAAAFEAVIAAYRLPRGTEDEQCERTRQVRAALVGAAAVPARLAAAAERLVSLCEQLVDRVDPQVVSDVGVAAASARAALDAAILNVEINVAALGEPDPGLRRSVEAAGEAAERAAATVATVRRRIAGA